MRRKLEHIAADKSREKLFWAQVLISNFNTISNHHDVLFVQIFSVLARKLQNILFDLFLHVGEKLLKRMKN